jgi:hypothetical protein
MYNVAYTAFVDATFGVAHPQLTNPNASFISIMLAITAILNSTSPPSIFQSWNIQVNPGTYFESPTLPSFVNLIGAGQATAIVGTLTVTGSGIVENLLIDTTNNYSVAVNRPVNIGDAAFSNVVIVNGWSGTFTHPITAINIIVGDCTFESGAIFGTFTATAPEASLVNSAGGLALFNVLSSITTSSGIVNTKIFSFTGPKSTITECAISASLNGGSSASVFAGVNITASMKENRITLTSNLTTEVDIVSAGNDAVILLTGNYIDTSTVDTVGGTLYLARGVHTSGAAPQVRFLADEFVLTPIPPAVGTFGQLDFDLFDYQGSFKFSGGFYSHIKSICTGYTVQPNDYTLLITCDHSHVTLPTGQAGQVIYLKNLATADARISGNIFDRPVIHLAGSKAVNLQTDGSLWYILAE